MQVIPWCDNKHSKVGELTCDLGHDKEINIEKPSFNIVIMLI